MNCPDDTSAGAASMVSMCSLRSGLGLFGIDTRQIHEVLAATQPQPVPLAPPYIAGVVPYRGEVLTAVSLRTLLGRDPGDRGSCLIVLDDEESDERFGLAVDGVGGVVMIEPDSLIPNPSTLDARSLAIFSGAYRLESGLMVRLDTRCLRPSRLKENRMFGGLRPDQLEEGRCAR